MRTRRARAERSGRGCDGARVGAQPALGEDLARGSFALAAASRDTEAVPELVEGLRPELRALTDLAVGDGVADADVHGEPRNANASDYQSLDGCLARGYR